MTGKILRQDEEIKETRSEETDITKSKKEESGTTMSLEEKKKLFREALGHYKNGEYEKAIACWQKILDVDPDHKQSKNFIEKARSKIEKNDKL